MDTKLQKQKKIVLAQLMATSPSIKLSIGHAGGMKTYTTSEIIEHVTKLDEFGQEYIETQMEFMRSLQNGDIYAILNEHEG